MPNTRTPRDLLLAALDRRRLTGYRASQDHAWVLFPPAEEGGSRIEVLHLPRANRFRVVSSHTDLTSTNPAATLGDFIDSEQAAACVAEVLNEPQARQNGHAGPSKNGTH